MFVNILNIESIEDLQEMLRTNPEQYFEKVKEEDLEGE